MRILSLLPLFALAACAGAPVTPYAVEITSPQQFSADLSACRGYAKAYSHPLSVSTLASGAGEGAAKNAAGAAVNPWVPVIGALGGAGQSLIDSLNLSDENQRKIVARCMEQKGERSHAYLIIDPN